MDPTAMFGPLDILFPYIEFVLLALALANSATRLLAHNKHVSQYRDGGAEAVRRYTPHDVTNVLLLLASFYYLTVALEAGVILVMLVIGLVITDVFEFEARKVEARKEQSLDVPKAALAAWGLAFAYIAYRSLFFAIEPLWELVVA